MKEQKGIFNPQSEICALENTRRPSEHGVPSMSRDERGRRVMNETSLGFREVFQTHISSEYAR